MTIDLGLAFLKVRKSRARKEKHQSRSHGKSPFYHSPPLVINSPPENYKLGEYQITFCCKFYKDSLGYCSINVRNNNFITVVP